MMGLLLLVGCQNEEENNIGETGFFVSLANDVEVTTKSTPEELGEPYKTQFKLKVVDQATGVVKYSGNYKNGLFINTPAGSYTLTAECGSNPVLALDKPYYLGEAEGSVTEGQKTTVQIPCKVANALTSVMFDNSTSGQSFDEDFADYYVQVAVDTDNSHSYSTNVNVTKNGKSAYYQVGTMPKYTFIGILKEGGTEYKYELTNDKFNDPANYSAGTNLKLTLSMAKVDAGLKVVVEKVEVSKVDINETIPLEWLSKPKLEASSTFTNNAISIVETESVSNATIKLNTAGALQDLKMKFYFADEQFSSLNEKEYLLSDATDKATVEEVLGITLPEIGTTNGSLDFTSVVNRLLTNNGTATVNTIELDAKANNRWSSEDDQTSRLYTLTCEKPEFGVHVSPSNIWTMELTMDKLTKDYVQKGDFDVINKNIKYQFSSDNSSWEDLNDDLRKAGLSPNQKYYVRALYRNAIPSAVAEVKTYPQTALENGGMENWSYTNGPSSWIDGPYWKRWYIRSTTDESTEGWCSLNAYTTSNNNIRAYCSNSGTERSDNKHSGSYAAEIKTIGWGEGTTAASPISVINKNTPGELFLGKMDNTTPVYGCSYVSKPTAIKFYYIYIPEGDHTFKVEISLYNGNTIIAKNEFDGPKSVNSSVYTEQVLSFNYDATIKDVEVSKLSIRFVSGDNSNSEVDKASVSRSSRHTGNKLYIDDISLIYDK